jgi:hypothetical protein
VNYFAYFNYIMEGSIIIGQAVIAPDHIGGLRKQYWLGRLGEVGVGDNSTPYEP